MPDSNYSRDYSMDYSALENGFATQGAADWCAAHGHAYRIVDGVQWNQCPRCLEQIKVDLPVGMLATETETTPAPGLRIRIHPAHDLYMRGVRFATVTGADIDRVTIKRDGTGQTFRIRNEYIMPVEPGGTLTWQIVVPPHGAVDETFSDDFLDALATARRIHGATAVVRLTGWKTI